MSSKRKTCDVLTLPNGRDQYIFRGSEFAMCKHRHIACLRGLTPKPPGPWLRKIFDAGNRSEPEQKATLERMGFRMLEFASGWEQQITLQLCDESDELNAEIILKISPDGRVQCPPAARFVASAATERRGDKLVPFRQYAVENKALGDDNFGKMLNHGLEFNESYKAQLSAACHAFREREQRDDIGCIFMAQLRNKDSTLVQRFAMWVYDEPPMTREEVLGKCWEIVKLHKAGEWPACDNKFPCDYPVSAPLGNEMILEAAMEAAMLAHRELNELLAGQSLPLSVGRFIVEQGGFRVREQ